MKAVINNTNPFEVKKHQVVRKSVNFIKTVAHQWSYECRRNTSEHLYPWGSKVFLIESENDLHEDESMSAFESFLQFIKVNPSMKESFKKGCWKAQINEKDFDGKDAVLLSAMKNGKERFSQLFVFR